MRGTWLERTPRQRLISNAVLAALAVLAIVVIASDGIAGTGEMLALVFAPIVVGVCVVRAHRGWRELRPGGRRRY